MSLAAQVLALQCPRCARLLGSATDLRAARAGCCADCGLLWSAGALLDLGCPERDFPPLPLGPGELGPWTSRMVTGADFKPALEQLLLALERGVSERLQQLLREGRGALEPLLALPAARGARALFLGNALSGTLLALARAGWSLCVLEPSRERLAFALARCMALAPPCAPRAASLALRAGEQARLPFADASFELVVQEDGLPGDGQPWGHSLSECARVCRGELWFSADNRLAYKRSSGRRGDFRVQPPHSWLGHALRARRERSLLGYRRELARAGFQKPREYALYPHSRDFTHLVALDNSRPRLMLGPKERENRAKTFALRAGLFPWLTPSYAFVAARGAELASAPHKLERLLAQLAERLSEPCPVLEHWVATRGNTSVVLTERPGADPLDPRGRWCLHLPQSPAQERQTRRHHARLAQLRREFPAVPVPAPLFLGELEGLTLACERRIGGLSTPQLAGRLDCARELYASLGPVLAQLAQPSRRVLDEALFEALVGAKFALVSAHAPDDHARARLEALRQWAREQMLGLELPLVLYHGDLRGKHVQVEEPSAEAAGGRLLAVLDWGSSEQADLPYFDLLHLVVHERKQAAHRHPAQAWAEVRERSGLAAHERAFLDDYARALALPELYCRTLEQLYPVLVAAMAEANWDYSRPRWLQENFGV